MRPAGLSESTAWVVFVVVILESRSPGSVVINAVENDRYWTETFQYDFYFYKQPTTHKVDPELNSG